MHACVSAFIQAFHLEQSVTQGQFSSFPSPS